MSRRDIVNELDILLSRNSTKALSGLPLRCYKYGMTAIFINMLSGRQLTRGQEVNYQLVYQIKKRPQDFKNQDVYNHFKITVETSLEAAGYKNPTDYETINKIFGFFKEIIEQTKRNGTFLTPVGIIENFLDIQKIYKQTNYGNIKSHHWINIDLTTGMILTVPEFFTYSDVVNNWNIFVDKFLEYNTILTTTSEIPLIEIKNNIENRRLQYEIGTLIRTLLISSVTFVESYLYYIFFNVKHSSYQFNTDAAKNFMKSQKVEDDAIIKSLILKEFITKPSTELKILLKKYKEINSIRNRLIHASAFESATKTSELLPLLNISNTQLIDTLITCKRLVEIIDNELPEDFKILVWWNSITHPDFDKYGKGEITNPESQLSKIKYMEEYPL